MHPKSADFGKICSPCMQNALQNAVGECISRVSCHEDPLFPSASLKSCTVGKSCHSFFDLSFVRELCDSCLRGSSGARPASRLDLYWDISVSPLREGANAVARPFVGVLASWVILYVEVQASWFVLRWGVSAAARPLREGASAAARPLCGGGTDAVVRLLRGNASAARKNRAPSKGALLGKT